MKQLEFEWQNCLDKLKHYLPSQSPLKDFIHHNTLHGFQEFDFFTGIGTARKWFGYQVFMSLSDYRKKYNSGEITETIVAYVIQKYAPSNDVEYWKNAMLHGKFPLENRPSVGRLREQWKFQKGIDFDVFIQPVLFQILGAFLDQGVAAWKFPYADLTFWDAVKALESNSVTSVVHSQQAKKLLFQNDLSTESLLYRLLGSKSLFEQYVFDQQFAHAGWSGLVATIESKPETLLRPRSITLDEIIRFQVLLELDLLYLKLEENWEPMNHWVNSEVVGDLFVQFEPSALDTVLMLWQRSLEISYYHEVLSGLQFNSQLKHSNSSVKQAVEQNKLPSFQALFCIDDRECSIRRHLETEDLQCETFGTPGFFNVEFYYKPENSNYVTKHCPAPVQPKYLIKEYHSTAKHKQDIHFNTSSHSIVGGWLISQVIGFWSALKLVKGIFFPSMDGNSSSSLNHLGETAVLSVEHRGEFEGDLQVGYTIEEMIQRAASLLKSIGMVNSFAPLVYIVGHGSSTTNNPHYAAYDCGACSGRPGSVNARVMATILNRKDVRLGLLNMGIVVPQNTLFIGALHDTTRDEIVYYTKELIGKLDTQKHQGIQRVFEMALKKNAKERARRFVLVDPSLSLNKVHKKVKLRSVSVFEPRPELNHATNALCIIGRREFSQNLFLDRRAFLNTYQWELDTTGDALYSIIRAAAPVCGGINLEYYFSKVDNNALGAGSKLPHNVVGLLGVSNGVAGDLRTGLPSQMIEVHDPIRLLMIVEQLPDVVLEAIRRDPSTWEWFANEWVNLVVFHPLEQRFYQFEKDEFCPYSIERQHTPIKNVDFNFLQQSADNLPVVIMN